jgi:hypothetical protein
VSEPEHRIRLRGGWQWRVAGEAGPPRRVALPIAWPDDALGRVLLSRPFNRPPLDPSREALRLELEQVDGLVAVLLNDRDLARPPVGTARLVVPLDDPLPGRNVLVLEVASPPAGRGGSGWGDIALVIGPAPPTAPDRREPLGGRGDPV